MFARRVFVHWLAGQGDAAKIESNFCRSGIRLAAGTKVTLVIDDATGFHAPLGRMLRQTAKARGEPLKLREQDIANIFPTLPPFEDARDAGLTAARIEAERQVDREFDRFIVEAETDDDSALAARLKKARARERGERRDRLHQTLKARRAEIVDYYRRRDRIRRARVNRAFRAARWGVDRDVRQLAFVAAAGVVALAGGGLGIALVAGGLAVAMLPDYERARALAATAAACRSQEATERAKILREVHADLAKHRPERLDFNKISKGNRVVGGFIAHCIVVGDAKLDGHTLAKLRRAERCIGTRLAEEIRTAVLTGPKGGAERLLGWYRWDNKVSVKALEAALRRAQEIQRQPRREGRER